MEEPGEQCTVVFALIVTEPASECVGGGRGDPTLAGSEIMHAKTTDSPMEEVNSVVASALRV